VCFWKNLANFVGMKKSIDFLPEYIQCDLHELVGLIREEIKDVVMIILYGSYAKGNYVIHDIQIGPNGETTEYHSDYDIMVITRKRLGEREGTVEMRIRSRFAEGKDANDVTKVQLVSESISKLNNALSQGHYFYVDAINEGIALYDSGDCELATPRDLNYTEIKQLAERYYQGSLQKALDYWEDAIRNIENKKYTHSSFFLHQATEYLLKSIPLVFILYRYKEHDLDFLLEKCKCHTLELVNIFPCKTKQERHVFDQLCKAYVEARYNDNFVVTKEEIDALVPKIKLLKQTVERVCKERFDYYDSQIEK
jgi:HEPN domain-containing protein/predicted nucleotidyltransferase